MRRPAALFPGALAVIALAVIPVMAQVQFVPLDANCGPAFFPTFCVVDMSGDGNTILFTDKIWTATAGFQPIGGPPGGFVVTALSDDGSTVVGDVWVEDGPLEPHLEAAIWRGGDQWQPLGGLPGSVPCGFYYTSAFDVSNDGRVVGLAWVGDVCAGAHAFEWTAAGGMVDKGSVVADASSRANTISADGNVIAGWSDAATGARLAATWTGGGPATWILPDSGNIFAGEAIGINSDGTVIVGGGYENYTDPARPRFYEPWLWTEETGVVPLGTAKGLRGALIDGQHYARDVSDDGSLVVGQDTLFNLGEQWAFIWTKRDGMNLLQDWVRARTDPATRAKICTAQRSLALQPCSGWDFWNVAAVSNDGKVIVGTGRNPNGELQAFMLRLP